MSRQILTQLNLPLTEVNAFCQRHHIRELSLFGSVLGDDFGPNSDIDVLVEFEPGIQLGFIGLSRIQRELSTIFGRPVDLVPKRGLKKRIRASVLESAEVLYAA